tara:strand:- start:638 stop:1090 length:453 start_codon:yes stop_codon:yes gene_type:complete
VNFSIPTQPGSSKIPGNTVAVKSGQKADKKARASEVIGNKVGSNVDLSYMNVQLEEAKRAASRANQAYKNLQAEHREAQKQLANMNKTINEAVLAQVKNQDTDGPLKVYSKLQRRAVRSMGFGTISNKQSFGLAAITILLGVTAIIGRFE